MATGTIPYCHNTTNVYNYLFTNPYLIQLLRHTSVRERLLGKGQNIKNLNQQTLKSLIIPSPPRPLQDRFAEFVQAAEKSKTELQQTLDELDKKRKGILEKYL